MHSAVTERPRSQLQLKVDGMTCAGCAAAVQRAIESQPGVEGASVNVTSGTALVTGYDLGRDGIVAAIRERGYEARTAALDEAPAERRSEIELHQARHEREWRYRAIVGLSIWAPLEILHWTAKLASWHPAWLPWVMFAGATAVLVFAGGGFYRSAWKAARKRTTNMDTLIAIGATTAYVFSLVVFIGQLAGTMADQPLYFSEAAALLGIISLGHWFEARASAKAGSAVRELLELQPDEAELIDESGETRRIPSAEVQPGDRLLIRPGARVPVDGTVTEGDSEIDESVVTGESVPVRKRPGDEAVAGSMNTTGRLVIEATVDGRHTTVSRIAGIVEQAQTSKADVQRLADRVSAVFVPTVLGIAAVTFVGWLLAGNVQTGVIAATTVLIISCPCALGLATPMAVMVGAGSASHRGILVKSAGALERAGRAQRVVFDKTGTLTAGRPVVSDIDVTASGWTDDDVLRVAAAVEDPSEHPMARAIVTLARKRGLEIARVEAFETLPGEGVRGGVGGRAVEVRRDEQTTCRVTVDGELVATMTIDDRLRDDARTAIDHLHAMGLTLRVLTGDRREVALTIGRALGLADEEIESEATPESKGETVSKLGPGTLMVGDGINDAAALARADIGIAMASGTNIAIESADVVIPGDRVTAVVETIEIARGTLRTIRQNLFFAFFYNVLAIPAAAFGLLGLYGPLIAAAAMGLSDITVIGNALRLKARLSRSKNGLHVRAN